MEHLPKEIVNEIISNMTSCRDILNFCITNSKNKEMCKDDSIYLIKEAIRKKFPKFNVSDFIKKLEMEFDKKNQPSKKFSYLHGNGAYQKEFDSMPDIKINPLNPYSWKDIQKNLLKLSKNLKNNNEDNDIKNIIDSFTYEFTENLKVNITYFGKRQSKSTIFDDILNPYKDFEENYKKLQELNLDEIIDIFIRKNSDKWIDIGNYKEFNFDSNNYCFNIIPPVNFPEGTEKRKYVLTILCRILNINENEKMEKREVIIDVMNRFYKKDASWSQIEKYLKKFNNKKISIDENVYRMAQYTLNKDEAIEYMLKNEMCNKISLEIL
jgi:hypothetical protein